MSRLLFLSIKCLLCHGIADTQALPAQYTERIDLNDGLLNHRVCTVKVPVVESYFLCNTTHTNQAIDQNVPGGLVIQML